MKNGNNNNDHHHHDDDNDNNDNDINDGDDDNNDNNDNNNNNVSNNSHSSRDARHEPAPRAPGPLRKEPEPSREQKEMVGLLDQRHCQGGVWVRSWRQASVLGNV